MAAFVFEYSQEFKDLIVEFHKGKENLSSYQSYIQDHLGGASSRLSRFASYLWPEISHHCGELKTKRVLDFGCGTGATTVVLALNCGEVVAFDIDERATSICQRRLQEHGLMHKVEVSCAPDFTDIMGQMGTFDFILMNGVIEHIPLSLVGLRKKILLSLFNSLKTSGYLYINETPNRLWPKDAHTTTLWWIPWTTPGSRWAYEKAVRKGKHLDNPTTHSNGPLGLEERGAWGVTFFDLKGYLSEVSFKVINSISGHDRHLAYTRRTAKQLLFDSIVYYSFSKWTKTPITAFAPYISHLVIQKLD